MLPETVNRDLLFMISDNTRIREHKMKLVGSRTNKRKFFFTQRVIILWNSEPQDTMKTGNLTQFKRGLDKFVKERSINWY